MIYRLFRLTFTLVLLTSLAGKVLAQDFCDNPESSKNTSVISYHNSIDLSGSSDFSDCKDCGCHCHHHHFDFASFSESFTLKSIAVENSSFDPVFSALQINSPKKPPKIAS